MKKGKNMINKNVNDFINEISNTIAVLKLK